MITRTINNYKVNIKRFVLVDEENAKLEKVGEFNFTTVGKPTDTEIRKAAKLQGIALRKGDKLFTALVSSETWGMNEEFFMANAQRIK